MKGFVFYRFKEVIIKLGLVKCMVCVRFLIEYGEFQVYSYVFNDGLEYVVFVEVFLLYLFLFYLVFEQFVCIVGYFDVDCSSGVKQFDLLWMFLELLENVVLM